MKKQSDFEERVEAFRPAQELSAELGPQGGQTSPQKRKILPFVIGGGVLAVAILLAVFLVPKLFASPKSQVWKAFAKLGAEWEFPVAEEIGWESLMTAVSSKQSMELELYLDELPASTSPDEAVLLKNMGVRLAANSDQDEKQMDAELMFRMGGSDLFSFQFYGDEDLLSLAIPELFNGALGIGTGNLREQVENSPLFDQMNLSESELAELDFSLNPWEWMGKEGNEELTERLMESLRQLEEAIRVEKKDQTKKISIGGEKQECQGYVMVIPKEDVLAFLEEYMAVYQDALKQQMELFGTMNTVSMYGENPWEEMEGDFEDLLDEIDKIMEDEWDVEVYLTKSGDLAQILVKDLSDWVKEDIEEIQFELTFSGEERPSDEIYLSMMDSYEDGIFAEKTTDRSKTETITRWSIGEESNGKKNDALSIENRYNSDSQEFSYRMNLEEEEIELFVEGSLGEVEKGKSVVFEIDALGLQTDGERMAFAGSLTYGELEESIEKPSDIRMVMEMDEEEFEELGTEFLQGIQNLQNALMQILY
ncbi:hypothetical protein [Hominifimenecus sp. rT4P-3]|uniref:hypothetical protein n=1 Tax=Hominifimenecus sp. rT4P-3 TaxID=3242979 RepID=UPI003DA22063